MLFRAIFPENFFNNIMHSVLLFFSWCPIHPAAPLCLLAICVMCLFVLQRPHGSALFTRYWRHSYMYFTSQLCGLGGGGGGAVATSSSHVLSRGGLAQQGGDQW